jgi:hypothetical protein
VPWPLGCSRSPYYALLDTAIPGLIVLAVLVAFAFHDLMWRPLAALTAECFTPRLRYSGASIGLSACGGVRRRPSVTAYGSLAYGMLSGAFHAGMQFEENDRRSKAGNLGSLNLFRSLFGPEHFPRNLAAVEQLKPLATKYGKSLPQFALRWTLSNPVVSTALVGFRTPAEVSENLARSAGRPAALTWPRSMPSSPGTVP